MARSPSKPTAKQVEALKHDKASRRNIPTAEYQSLAERLEATQAPEPAHYPRARPLPEGSTRERDADLDPQIVWRGARIRVSKEQARQLLEKGEVEIGDAQLVWKGKDRQDWSDLVVPTPPIYVQEKIHPKALIDDLKRRSKDKSDAPDLFADFNGLDDPEARTEFYQHDQHWSNRFILGDSLAVMASLAEREALRGKVQCIYFDPPYGIKFNSNWQVSTLSRDVKDGKQTDISREPEQIKAFRDTWKDGIHSYLTYLRDRLTVARELLTESGSIFVQIGDENVHRVRAVMDEVFGADNLAAQIVLQKVTGVNSRLLAQNSDYLLWYSKKPDAVKFRAPLQFRENLAAAARYDQVRLVDGRLRALTVEEKNGTVDIPAGAARYQLDNLLSSEYRPDTTVEFEFEGKKVFPGKDNHWKSTVGGLKRLAKAQRLAATTGGTIRYVRMLTDFNATVVGSTWSDISGAVQSRTDPKIYVVQTSAAAVQRCVLMTTDPGDLVLDPTCGSGTTATVAEQWGRRWITIDTSRVALALARMRLMGARYNYYLLADSIDGRRKEQEIARTILPDAPTHQDIRQGFVYERAPHVTLKSIANNAEIDVIYDKWQQKLEPLRAALNAALGKAFEDWQIPREADPKWPAAAKQAHAQWWEGRIARQKEIDASIARAADVELLYDRPYEDKTKVRVAGPFTVESLSPHRVVPADEEELIDLIDADAGARRRLHKVTPPTDFSALVLENLRAAGVHQSEKRDTIRFVALTPWPGEYVGAEGRFMEGETERRAAIFIGPEFGTLTRVDLVAAAREAIDARFDALIACAFAFDAHASEMAKLGPLPILKAKMNPDLHMAGELKITGKGNLFVVFGEPDIEIEHERDGRIKVRVKGVDVYDPNTGEIRSNDIKGIAAWFVDDDYDEESFFVRQAYFLGANDPYKSLKAALRAEIDEEAWSTLYRAESRPFARPKTGKIAVKVINHFGDEVMKVYRV
jgi:adenine-specific DNA-methyltransferase